MSGDFCDEARRLMADQDIGVRELARRIPCNHGHLSMMLRGKRPLPASVARRIAQELGAGHLLRPQPHDGDPEEPVQRREFLSLSAALAASGGYPVTPKDGPRAAARYVQGAEHALDQMQDLEERFGSGKLRPLVEDQAAELARVLKAGVDAPGLHSVAAWAHMLAGWTNYDTGNNQHARRLYKEALFLAQLAGDRGMEVCVVTVMSSQAVYLNRATEALRLAQLGARQAPSRGPVAALIAIREARAWAMLGAERETAEATRRAFDAHASSGPTPRWARFFGEGELLGQAARNARELRQWRPAVELVDRAVRDSYMPLRARVMYAVDLAEVLACRGDTLAAIGVLQDIRPSLERVSSARLSAQLHTLATLPVEDGHNGSAWREQLEDFG